MKISGGFVFAVVLFALLILLLITALGYPFKAAIFPLITVSVALILLGSLILPREILALRQKGEDAEVTEAEETRGKYLSVVLWLIVTQVMLWLLGFLATVFLLPLLYLRRSGEKWPLFVGLPLASVIFFYVVFSLLLETPLYEGYLFSLILG